MPMITKIGTEKAKNATPITSRTLSALSCMATPKRVWNRQNPHRQRNSLAARPLSRRYLPFNFRARSKFVLAKMKKMIEPQTTIHQYGAVHIGFVWASIKLCAARAKTLSPTIRSIQPRIMKSPILAKFVFASMNETLEHSAIIHQNISAADRPHESSDSKITKLTIARAKIPIPRLR